MTNTIEIDGEYTTAEIKTEDVDETTIEQVEKLVDHPAFTNPVKIMPDAHAGAGAVIGFTMAIDNKVVPNTVGVDIGCGMTAINVGRPGCLTGEDETVYEMIDREIRDTIPMGWAVHGDAGYPQQEYHMADDFPWLELNKELEQFEESFGGITPEGFSYDINYLKDVCERVGYDVMRCIDSVGSLGGGNHFVEISQSEETGDYWVVVHSGSRGIGLSIAQHWQDRAIHLRSVDTVRDYLRSLDDDYLQYVKFDVDEVSDEDLLDWVQGGMGEDFVDFEALKADYKDDDPEVIGEVADALKGALDYTDPSGGEELAWLEGEERHGYFRDMLFAQKYAAVSRMQMVETVADILDSKIRERIVSTHNYIDFRDAIIRKGATRVHNGERAVIPFNMAEGSIIVRGQGTPEWNMSAPHGAGRRGSRRWAYETFSVEQFEDSMEGIFSTSVNENTLDECPQAYKDTNTILDSIHETAEIEETLTPVINLKADE